MVGVHTEQAFEDAIEAHLLAHGYVKGNKSDFDLSLALDRAQLLAFVKDSQPTGRPSLGELPSGR